MKTACNILTDRIQITFDSTEEANYYTKHYGWRCRNLSLSVEDTTMNRLILGLPYYKPKFIAQPAVDGLYDFQVEDVKRLSSMGNSLNANAMGTGKTIEALACIKTMNLKTGVIFTKKSCITQWCEAIKKWLPGATCFGYLNKQSQTLPKLSDVDFIVTNYEKLVGNYIRVGRQRKPVLNAFGEYLCGRRHDILIADEAHMICSIDSARHILINKIPSRYRQGLTGTPIINKPDNLYGLLNWINPKLVGTSYWKFVDAFCRVDDTNPFGRKILGLTRYEENQEVLHKLLETCSVRHTLEEVVKDLPPIVEYTVTLDMDAEQSKRYKAIKKLIIEELPDNLPIQNGLVQTIRLQQQASCPKILDSKAQWGPKFEFVSDFLETDENMRLVVFSPYALQCEHLKKYLEEKNIECAIVTGKASSNIRAQMFSTFIKGKARVLIGTIGAIGTGVDGLQRVCKNIIFLDKSWSPEEMRQAVSRLYRIGQEHAVSSWYLECNRTIDKKVGRININKLKDIKSIFDDTDIDTGEYKLFTTTKENKLWET